MFVTERGHSDSRGPETKCGMRHHDATSTKYSADILASWCRCNGTKEELENRRRLQQDENIFVGVEDVDVEVDIDMLTCACADQ